MLLERKSRVVTMGEVRTDYPGQITPLLTLDQRDKIAELARRTGLSEEEIARRLVTASQPSIDKVINAALRLMVMQEDATASGSH